MNSSDAFNELLAVIRKFRAARSPYNEKDLENSLEKYLRGRSLELKRQESARVGRYDLRVYLQGCRFAIEMKRFADRSCINQLDKYTTDSDGVILVCWQASQALQDVFKIAESRLKVPVALVQVKYNSGLI